jgi:hypothetical protein
MPWLRNEHTQFPDELIGVLNNASSTVRHELYRSRNPIDTGLFSYIAMLFRLPMVPADKQNTRNRFKTVAMPRGVEPQQAYDAVGSYLEQMQYTHNYSRAVLFVNTDNNQAVTPFVIEKLKEQGWEAHDYRTALACTPFHQLDVLTITQQGATQMHVVVFTNVLNDEFILKFGGIMPLLYGYEIPEAMTNAFLECDKQAFFAAYAPIMVEILAAQRRAEQEHTLNDLTTYLSRGQQDRLERNIASKQNDITSLENSLRSSYAQLQEFLLQKSSTLWGLADNSIADFIQYIKDYDAKNITHMSFNAGYDSFNIVIVTSLLYWDEEVYKSFRASTRMNCVTEQSDAVKKLLDNIFLDKTVQVIFHTGISIHFNHCTVERNTSILSDGSSQIGIPHTHIYHHNCLVFERHSVSIVHASGAPSYLAALSCVRRSRLWRRVKCK